MKKLALILFTLAIIPSTLAKNNSFFEQTQNFFEKNVQNGRVDYDAIYSNPSELNTLVKIIETYSWTENEEKAYLINAYNILVIAKIINNYPLGSPMDVTDFFDKSDLKLNSEKISLNKIENKLLRDKYKDARLHFVLVCGAVGCPAISSNAYTPDSLEAQLEHQTKLALNNPRFIWQDSSQDATMLSEIFNWYGADFGGTSKSVFEFINKYVEVDFRSDFPIIYYNYNWTLNKIETEINSDAVRSSDEKEFNLQTFTAGSLLGKNKFDFTVFNTLYTQDHDVWQGIEYSGYRSTFVTHLFQITYGISKSKRINVGLDFNLKNSGKSVDSTLSGLKTAFGYNNTDSSRFGLTSIGARVKIQPFKSAPNFTIQSTVLVPTIKDAEGKFVSNGSSENRFWADWDRITWWNQFYYTKTWGKIQLFAEIDLLFRIKKYTNQYTALDTPLNLFLSYFPTSKITIYAMTQHVPRFTFQPKGNPAGTDWVIPANYTASGLGFKYQLGKNLNLELLYSNFWRGANSGLGSTYNLGIKYVMY